MQVLSNSAIRFVLFIFQKPQRQIGRAVLAAIRNHATRVCLDM